MLDKYLKDFEVRMGGTTSIDVSRKGIDKAKINSLCIVYKFLPYFA